MEPKKTRIAVYISSMQGGGAQRAILKTATGIAERGYHVDLVLAKATGPYMAEIPNNVHIVDLKARSVATSLPGLVRYLRQYQPVAMLSALNYVNIMAIIARKIAGVSTRLIISERNTVSISTKKFLRMRGRLFVPFLMKLAYPWADGIVAVSNGVREDLLQFLSIAPERVHVVYNPIITTELKAKATEHCVHQWFLPDQPPVLVAVGRLQPQKDFPLLINAFAQVRAKEKARLLILGEGPDHAALQSQVQAKGLADDVALPGFDANPYVYMKHAAAFVLSSQWEGLPGVLIEALYCETPVIATNCPSGPQEILDNGNYGRLVPVGDVGAMANAIQDALRGEIMRPPAQSWSPFTVDAVVDNYLQILVNNHA